MWARVARFDGDPADVDDRIGRLRGALAAEKLPAELAGAMLLLLVDRESGGMLGVTLFGLLFTPVFYVVVRWIGERTARPSPKA